MTNLLIIGSGGREHAFGVVMAEQFKTIFFAPGNAGTAGIKNGKNIDVNDPVELVEFVKENNVGLVIIGPEDPLVSGLADNFRQADIPVIGPSSKAAQLEASKGFAVEFMKRHHIPHPESWQIENLEQSKAVIGDRPATDFVIKADGLCGGKGVVLPVDEVELKDTLAGMLSGETFGDAGTKVTLQERLSGPEVSLFALSDGENVVILPTAQDHKRLKDGDKGPNTGGMGAYGPVPTEILSSEKYQKIVDIAHQTIKGMRAENTPYQGILYVGVMLAKERDGDPVVIEYNVRFGDPEAQVVLPLLKSVGVDLAKLFNALANGRLDSFSFDVSKLKQSAMTVCLASYGYPTSPRKGDTIKGLHIAVDKKDVTVFHGGTVLAEDNTYQTNGGRVLYVTGIGEDLDEAAGNIYSLIGDDGIHFDDMQYRQDIGHQARKQLS